MKTSNGMFVRSNFDSKCSRQNFLDHRERENIVWQPDERVVRTHVCKHYQPFIPNHDLQGTSARNSLVVRCDICSIKQLNYRSPCGLPLLQKVNHIEDLVVPIHSEQTRTVCTIDSLTIIRFSCVMG